MLRCIVEDVIYFNFSEIDNIIRVQLRVSTADENNDLVSIRSSIVRQRI